MFPKIQDLTVVESSQMGSNGKSFLFDFVSGDFVVRNGSLVECYGTNAIKVWVEKILHTEKGRFKIYGGTDYGCHLEDLIIGNNYPMSFIESELKREIEDALMQNPNIKAVSDFALERTKSGITVSLEVETIDAGTNTFTATL